MKTHLLALALLVALSAGCAEPPGHKGPFLVDPAPVNAALERYVSEGAYPFLYLRLEDREGRVFHEHLAVNRQLLPVQTLDGQSWIRIWSMSKIVTIAVAMDLVEDGSLSLDDPVARYLPEFAGLEVAVTPDGKPLPDGAATEAACPLSLVPQVQTMTVADLIHHKAGFYYPTTGIACLDEPLLALDLPGVHSGDAFIAKLGLLPLINQPGERHHYGLGTTVLGLVLERATGKRLGQLVAERVAQPMGIAGLGHSLPQGAGLPPRFSAHEGALRAVRASLPEFDILGAALPVYDYEDGLHLGGEGMVATADGYADFARMLLRGGELNGYRFLDEGTVTEMTAPHTQVGPHGHNGYNLWVSNGSFHDGEVGPAPLWIGGGYEGTRFWIDPVRGFVGIIMTQAYPAPNSALDTTRVIRHAVYRQLGGGMAFPSRD